MAMTWVGLTVAQVLSLCGASYAEVRPIDEPPGKLRALELECRDPTPHRVVLEIDYRPELFSATRTWAEALVRRQVVTAVRSP
jgi:hypothetical protein